MTVISSVALFAVILIVSILDFAQGFRTPEAWRKKVVEAHNELRKNFDAPVMQMGTKEKCSQKWASKIAAKGNLVHSQTKEYGENIAWNSEKKPPNAGLTVANFFSEIKDYDFQTNDGKGGVVGHFTQVVWKGSTHVCASYALGPRGAFSVFNYHPAGNYVGQNAANVKIKDGVTIDAINSHLTEFQKNAKLDPEIRASYEDYEFLYLYVDDDDYRRKNGGTKIESLSAKLIMWGITGLAVMQSALG